MHPRTLALAGCGLAAAGAQLQVDGRMGPTTRLALKAFQQQHNLKVTGQPDAPTMKALGG
jgi:peptidoglycan hydrolase-like protein with peptidoglycan-binding domain